MWFNKPGPKLPIILKIHWFIFNFGCTLVTNTEENEREKVKFKRVCNFRDFGNPSKKHSLSFQLFKRNISTSSNITSSNIQ